MRLERAQGCLLGQLTGDALGSLVEFQSPIEIRRNYPNGVCELSDGGTWNTIAGQPTDDSEMALLLGRTLDDLGTYDPDAAFAAYRFWLESDPFDCGMTISLGLQGRPNFDSQANGALMRISPLGIFGANYPLETVGGWARQDAELTHPNPVCLQANSLFAMALAHAIHTGPTPASLYNDIVGWAVGMGVNSILMDAIVDAAGDAPMDTHGPKQGWVIIAFRNALWQMLHAPSLKSGVADTVSRGGDTDTNGAICGALMGAVYGLSGIPWQWRDSVLNCRPEAGKNGVHRPRPDCFWPVDALELAGRLVSKPTTIVR